MRTAEKREISPSTLFKQGVLLVESAADSVVAVVLVGWDGCEVRLCDLCARVPCER